MTITWMCNKKIADRCEPAVKSILGRELIRTAPPIEDDQCNTGPVAEPLYIACSIRDIACYPKCREEFLIRNRHAAGGISELPRILQGWGQYLFCGFGNTVGDVVAWGIGDLKVFRAWYVAYILVHHGQQPGMEHKNRDIGDSTMRVFRWQDLPTNFIVSSHGILSPDSAAMRCAA